MSHFADPEASLSNGSTLTRENTRVEKRPSIWQRTRNTIRAPIAEFIAVALLVIIGAGANCAVTLSTNTNVAPTHKGEFLSSNLGWAIGLALGVWTCAGISGGHVNPAITLVMATRRGFSWKKVPFYILAQLLGGLVGAAIIYGEYSNAIDIVEGGRSVRTQTTASLFSSFALDYTTQVTCFFSEFLGTAILAFMIIAATDKNNTAPPVVLLPVVVFLTFLGLGIALGMQTSFAFNPARDLGPRLFLSMAGYGSAVYSFRNQYWLWCMVLAPILGAQCSVLLYDLFLYDTAGANAANNSDADHAHRHEKQPRRSMASTVC